MEDAFRSVERDRLAKIVAHDEYLNRTYTIDNPEPLSLERRFNEKMAKRQRKVEQLKCVWLEAADALEAEKLRRAVSEGAQARVQYRLLQHEYTRWRCSRNSWLRRSGTSPRRKGRRQRLRCSADQCQS